MSDHSPSKQHERRRQVYGLYLQHMRSAVGEDCSWHGFGREQGFREKMWHCFALLSGGSDDVCLANRILEALPLDRCHFSPMSSMQLLLKHERLLTERVISKLETYVKASLPRLAQDRIHYTMYNDNFAGMAAFTLLTAGERFGDTDAFEAGLEKLRGLQEVFTRNGTIMEYCSPTYIVTDLHPLAEMVNHVQDPAVRDLALKCEERMWAELATHYHAPSALLAGPYSRAYMVDTVGHPHQVCYVLYFVFGDAVFINPVADLFPPHDNQVIHHGLDTLMWPSLIWHLSGDYHCPDYLADILLNKPFPFTVVTKSECLPSRIEGYRTDPETGHRVFVPNILEFGGFSGPNTTYMTEDYALGTAYSQFHDGGLSESFYVVYRKKRPATNLTETGVVFARYIINDRIPDQDNDYSVYGKATKEAFRDEGRKFGMQHESCSMMVYKPKQFEAHSVSSMKLSIMFPCHFGWTQEVVLGDENRTKVSLKPVSGTQEVLAREVPTREALAREALAREVPAREVPAREVLAGCKEPCPVFVKDGPLYMAFKPLTLTDRGREAAVKIERLGNYLALSFYNYEGPRRSFEVEEMLLTSSGFIAHLGTVDEYESFDAFIADASRGTISDCMTKSEGAVTRWVRYKRDSLDMHFAYSPLSEGIMIDTIGGKPRPRPIFAATGLDTRRLPFLES